MPRRSCLLEAQRLRRLKVYTVYASQVPVFAVDLFFECDLVPPEETALNWLRSSLEVAILTFMTVLQGDGRQLNHLMNSWRPQGASTSLNFSSVMSTPFFQSSPPSFRHYIATS